MRNIGDDEKKRVPQNKKNWGTRHHHGGKQLFLTGDISALTTERDSYIVLLLTKCMWKVGKIPCLPPDSSPFLQTYKPNEGCFYDAKLRIPPIPCKFYLLFFDHCPSELSLFSSIRGLFSSIRGQSDSQAVQFCPIPTPFLIYIRARVYAPPATHYRTSETMRPLLPKMNTFSAKHIFQKMQNMHKTSLNCAKTIKYPAQKIA